MAAMFDFQIKTLDTMMGKSQGHFQRQRSEVKAKFDGLHQLLDRRQGEILSQLQREEDDVISPMRAQKRTLEEQKASLAARASSVERMVVPAPDGALLGMLADLKKRLDGLERGIGVPDVSSDVTVVSVSWNSKIMSQLEQAIGDVGLVERKATVRLCWFNPFTTVVACGP